MQRWGFTFPFDGLPLHAHKDALQELESLGYTDAWSYEIDGVDCFTPLALAATWTQKMTLGTAIATVYTRAPLTLAITAAGELGDGAIINWLGAKDVPRCVAAAREGAERAGKDPASLEIVARIFVCVTEEAPVIDFIGRRMIAAYLNVPVYAKFHEWLGRADALRPMWDAWQAGDRKAATAAISPRTIDELIVHGDAETCRRKVQEYVDAGVTVPSIQIVATAPDPKARVQQTLDALRALAPR